MTIINRVIIAGSMLACAALAPLYAMEMSSQATNDTIENLQLLSFMRMNYHFNGQQFGDGTFALKSDVPVQWFNHAFAVPSTTEQEVDAVLNFMNGLPFGWRVGENQPDVRILLEDKGLICSDKVYLMQKSFENEMPNQQTDQISSCDNIKVVKAVTLDGFMLWNTVSAKSTDSPKEEVLKFSKYILNHANDYLIFWYIGYAHDNPISTGILIEHLPSRKATIHLVTSMEDPCKQEVYIALINQMLEDAYRDRFGQVLVWSLPSVHDVDQKLGFKDVETYFIYTPPVVPAPTATYNIF